MSLRFVIITCSDTRTINEDTAGAYLAGAILNNDWKLKNHVVVKDNVEDISAAIIENDHDVDVILTCGGTGLSLRDVTPEATMAVCERNVPGVAEYMRSEGLRKTPNAALSRALCMQRGKTLVVNMPGSLKAAKENWDALEQIIEHAVKMMRGGGH
ncbi:MAG: MogA/MoaB family molybdenum cofactor biosynthesis protein [Coriobacteriales bacterium]|nr:MogA/MoaB family molybdenum cofactor biosynthesis protein [Coriobacteriales bacterium]